jgi:hypothetical protein
LDLYAKALPGYMAITTGQFAPVAQEVFGAAKAITPQELASTLSNLQRFGPAAIQTGNTLAAQQAAQQLAATAPTALGIQLLDRIINPEVYAAKVPILDSLTNLLSVRPENVAAERYANQLAQARGDTGNVNPSSIITNALNFGQYGRQGQSVLNEALNTATNVLNSLRVSDVSAPIKLAPEFGNVSRNFASQFFNPSPRYEVAQIPASMAENLMRNITALGGANRSVGGSTEVKLCFITTAVAGNGEELRIIKRFRDGWLLSQPFGEEMVRLYYSIAPYVKIHDRELLYWVFIKPCVEDIKAGRYLQAFERYVKMVVHVICRSLL